LPGNLLAEVETHSSYAVTRDKLKYRVQDVVTMVGDELNLTPGEVDMFFMDLPDIDLQYQPVMVAQVNQGREEKRTSMRTMGICYPVPNDGHSGENVIMPKASAADYLRSFEQKKVPYNPPAVLTILEQPKHGVLHLVTEDDRGTLFGVTAGPLASDASLYAYFPDKDYVGDDKAVFLIELQDVKVKVAYFFQSIPEISIGGYGIEEYCKKTGFKWKISSTVDSNNASTITSVSYLDPGLGQEETLDIEGLNSWLSSLDRSAYLGKDINFATAPLQNGALGVPNIVPNMDTHILNTSRVSSQYSQYRFTIQWSN
jgi:hypothetical protein